MKKRYLICIAAMVLMCFLNAWNLSINAQTVTLIADNTAEMAERSGMNGRLIIPDADISVALFDVRTQGAQYRQAVTDAEDSAAWFQYGNSDIVADHNEQGFIRITRVTAGKSYAYVQKGNEIKKYVCVDCGVGQNTLTALIDRNGHNFCNYDPETMVTYTCYDGWKVVYYAVWTPVENFRKKRIL